MYHATQAVGASESEQHGYYFLESTRMQIHWSKQPYLIVLLSWLLRHLCLPQITLPPNLPCSFFLPQYPSFNVIGLRVPGHSTEKLIRTFPLF